MTPVVSVCIASYNHARFLPRCLESILAQTYQDFNIVVVDDGSTDNSCEILESFQRQYPEKIQYSFHPNHANSGYVKTTNAAIRASSGKYIAFIGSDDVWYPHKLAVQMAFFERQPDVSFVYSYAQYIDEQGNDLPEICGVDITTADNPTGQMIFSCHMPAMTVVAQKECLEKLGLFDEKLIYSDWDLMVRLTATTRGGFIAEPLAQYRLHGSNL
jgi:glycosyltransferase involved in cell wall biosynthesis